MTPAKKEADELVANYMLIDTHDEDPFVIRKQRAKNCALIAVRKIIELCEFDSINDWMNQRNIDKLNFWDEVEQEILKL